MTTPWRAWAATSSPCSCNRANREMALNRAIHVAEQILASLVKPFVLEGREFFVTASIGIALSPQDGNELSQLMKNADTAMYHAKERGKNNFQFYQADMNASALERLELESDLRHALEQNEFVLYYQPQFSGDGKRLTGAEALLRWRHPRRGLVPPGTSFRCSKNSAWWWTSATG
jgi:predicted signal transduction protein with EAL and GGDEF domain